MIERRMVFKAALAAGAAVIAAACSSTNDGTALPTGAAGADGEGGAQPVAKITAEPAADAKDASVLKPVVLKVAEGKFTECKVTAEGGKDVKIKMTLTAPGCGMGPVLAGDVKMKIEKLPGVQNADVEVVFDPVWDRSMMSEAARLQLGMMW